jgi:hypothetical protein
MKANEFRLGIWVTKRGITYIMDEDELEVMFAARDYEDFKGVPLTEEWLLKFGFDKWFLDYGFNLRGIICDIFYNVNTRELRINGDIKIPIEYVHQLQNLYFALTGEELTLKETEIPNKE